jgi:hypothetical protein
MKFKTPNRYETFIRRELKNRTEWNRTNNQQQLANNAHLTR